jgi:hypothetical protein
MLSDKEPMYTMHTDVTELGIDDTSHFCNAPLDNIAKVLVIDVEILSCLCSGSTLLKLVLSEAVAASTIL